MTDERRLRVAVIGAGAVGGFFAAQAAIAGADVTVCVRRPIDRLVIRSGDGEITPDVRIVTSPGEVGPVDWVFLTTKAHQVPGAMPWLAALVGPSTPVFPGTCVVVMQNGVRQVERISPPVPADQVLPSVIYVNAEAVEPGVIVHRNYGYALVPEGLLADRLASVLPAPGMVRPTRDFAVAAWSKLCVNSAANSLTALTGRRLEVMRRADVGELALALMGECMAVAAADGAAVDPGLATFTVDRLRGQPPDAGTSMVYDRIAGRTLEHEALIGAVVRIGAEYGVPTPVCSVIATLLAAVSDGPGDGFRQAPAGR